MREGVAPEVAGLVAAISDRMVQLHKELYGKGPTRVRTYVFDDLVVCLFRESLTTFEETLVESGRERAVIEQRLEVTDIVSQRYRAAIAEIMGRSVIGFMGASQVEPDMIAHVFVLEPVDEADV